MNNDLFNLLTAHDNIFFQTKKIHVHQIIASMEDYVNRTKMEMQNVYAHPGSKENIVKRVNAQLLNVNYMIDRLNFDHTKLRILKIQICRSVYPRVL